MTTGTQEGFFPPCLAIRLLLSLGVLPNITCAFTGFLVCCHSLLHAQTHHGLLKAKSESLNHNKLSCKGPKQKCSSPSFLHQFSRSVFVLTQLLSSGLPCHETQVTTWRQNCMKTHTNSLFVPVGEDSSVCSDGIKWRH